MTKIIAQQILNAGEAEGVILKLDDPLSFWGGFDPQSGIIIDIAHPQKGRSIAGKILQMPGSRGSAGTPAGVAEAIRAGKGPKAILLGAKDINITVGTMVAKQLYGLNVPVLVLDANGYDSLKDGDQMQLQDGQITVSETS